MFLYIGVRANENTYEIATSRRRLEKDQIHVLVYYQNREGERVK